MSKKDTVTKAFMRENTVFADAFNRIKQVPCFHCEKLTAAVQEVKKNAWYEKERLNMEEHLSTDTSDPISVIKDYIRSHLSDPDLGRTSITDKIHMNPDYLSHIFSTKTEVQKKNRVYWNFSFLCTLFHFLPTKIRQIFFQIVLRLLQIFLPDALHNIVMMSNVQCWVYVGPGLPVKLGVSAF